MMTAGSNPSSSVDGTCQRSLLDVENIDPYAFYERRRAEGEVVWDEGLSAWLVLGYQECRTVELDEDRFSNPYVNAPAVVQQIKGGRGNITLSHGEEHARLRRFHISLLTPNAVAGYRQQIIKPIVDDMLDRITARGAADLAIELADQIPPRVIIALLGMDWRDDKLVTRTVHLHEEVMAFIGHNYSKAFEQRGLAASTEIEAILRPIIQDRKRNPREDFVSRVWQEAPDVYGEMTEDIAMGICRELYLGGTDTTIHAIANALYLLLTDASFQAAVATDAPGMMKGLVEETMRLYGSVQYRYRIAKADDVLAGVPIAKGQKLVLLHAAANRDPRHYACPNAVDFGRKPLADHLAFNVGPRACVGALLARAEIEETLKAVVSRLPQLAVDDSAEPPRNRGLFLRSFRPLHVRWSKTSLQESLA
jgi:cytochrome P450